MELLKIIMPLGTTQLNGHFILAIAQKKGFDYEYAYAIFEKTFSYSMIRMIKIFTLLFFMIVKTSQAQILFDFSLKNVINGESVALSDFSSQSALVLIFTSVACPFDSYYTNRLKQLQTDYSNKLPILLVNSYTEAPEAEEWMQKTALANGLSLPYLSDKEQKLMSQLGAERSPEAFLLKNINGQFTVVYHGLIDDNPQVETAVKQSHLKNAIDAVLSAKLIAQSTTRSVGCHIRKK